MSRKMRHLRDFLIGIPCSLARFFCRFFFLLRPFFQFRFPFSPKIFEAPPASSESDVYSFNGLFRSAPATPNGEVTRKLLPVHGNGPCCALRENVLRKTEILRQLLATDPIRNPNRRGLHKSSPITSWNSGHTSPSFKHVRDSNSM